LMRDPVLILIGVLAALMLLASIFWGNKPK